MGCDRIFPMGKDKRITWVSGPAKGFYIDFESQKIGFSDQEKGLNRLQTRLLFFMLSSPAGFITASDTANDKELFSIDFSKYISAIKSAIKNLFKAADTTEDPSVLLDQILEKRSTYGNTGYRLRTELTDILDEVTSETSQPDLTPIKEQDDNDLPLGMKRYLKNNWLVLFIYVFLILGAVLGLDSMGITVQLLLVKIINLPFGYTFLLMCLLSVLPILGGILIDVPLAVKVYVKKSKIKESDLDATSKHNIAMNLVPRFDNSKENVMFFLICNLTGGFTASSVLLYAKSIPGITDYLSSTNHVYAFVSTMLVGCLVALFNNYSLQTTKSPTRCADDFILTRAHAFLNLIYLSVSISLGGALIYTYLSYKFFYGSDAAVITPAYIVMVLAAYCYLWFSSNSPAADEIDSISMNNFISGLPILAIVSTVYTIVCFKPDFVCLVSILTAPIFLVLWIFCLLKRKKENTLKFQYFISSFFSIVAIAIIIMLALNFWL